MADYIRRPIDGLSDAEKRIDLGDGPSLYRTWRASKHRFEQSSKGRLAEFNRRIVRRLSIETGIIERLYELDRGTTEALVAGGFAEDLITRFNTNIEPSRLIDLLRDQEAAIQLVIDCVAQSRALTKGLIHELHAILTNHQDTTTAVDQFGNRMEIPLLKGKYKEQPNNPRRPEGTIHEYCPPLHVDSEMEKLLHWLAKYRDEDPVMIAAWAHHRFTQIHPYQDGNGRVSRALTTMILLRSELLPLVIDRDLRVEYIDALESADLGELWPLATMFARLEREAILQAVSVDADAELTSRKTSTSEVIGSLQEKFVMRKAEQRSALEEVNQVAIELREQAASYLLRSFSQIERTVAAVGRTEWSVNPGGSDFGDSQRYKSEVGKAAREAGKFANLSENHYFVSASIKANDERLLFVVSFHHVGRELTGIMEATAFAHLESNEQSGSAEPFVFTHRTEMTKVANAFSKWLDRSLAIALKEFGDRL